MANDKKITLHPIRGQALLNFIDRINADEYELSVYDTEVLERVHLKQEEKSFENGEILSDGLVFKGDCLSTCAWLLDNNVKVDLVYIDPPFASGADYSAKIKLRSRISEKNKTNKDELTSGNSSLEEIMYGDIFSKESYLNWIYIRLLAIKEVMSDKASIYVHLDWHIGHYVKILMDEIFGENNFRNEIIWKYTGSRSPEFDFAKKHDVIFRYSKTDDVVFNPIFEDYAKGTVDRFDQTEVVDGVVRKFKITYRDGKEYKTYMNEGKRVEDVWDMAMVMKNSSENVDYATQKPQKLLQRIIEASSNQGMVVADFFGGSGVTAKVAKELGRKFVTCDVGQNALNKIRDGLSDEKARFEVIKIEDGLDVFKNTSQMKKAIQLCGGLPATGCSDLWMAKLPIENEEMALVHLVDNTTILDRGYLELRLERMIRESITCDYKNYLMVYVFKDDKVTQRFVDTFIEKKGGGIKVKLCSIDALMKDEATFKLKLSNCAKGSIEKEDERFKVKIESFSSPYLYQKIKKINEKKEAAQQLKISEQGYEFIENIQFDWTFNPDGSWSSDLERTVPEKGMTDEMFIFDLPTDVFRLKIRDISGEEIMLSSSDLEVKK